MRPDTTMERAAARLFGGARSPTRGSMSCGVTVVMEVMKDIAVKVARSWVRHRPSLGIRVSDFFLLFFFVCCIAICGYGRWYVPHCRREQHQATHEWSTW